MNDLTTAVHAYLTRAPSSLWAGRAIEMADHWEGDDNLLWRATTQDQEAVVKLFMDAGQARSRRQFDGHEVLAPRGLAPLPLWADRFPEGLARPIIVYTWSPGGPVDVQDPFALESWGEAVGRLHAVEIDAIRRFSPHPANLDYYWRIEAASLAQIQTWLGQAASIAKFLSAVTVQAERAINAGLDRWEGARPAAVHGDLRLAHSLVERGNVLFLDWEFFGLGDAALDVARLLHRERQTLTPDRQQVWLNAYLRTTDQPAIDERIALYQRLLTLHDLVFLLVGLEQQQAAGVTEELAAALPFLAQTLEQVFQVVAGVFGVPLPDTTAADLAAIFAKFQTPRT